MDTLTTGQRLRQMRLDRNMTREALAVQAGVSASSVMRAEQDRGVGIRALSAMLAVLDPDARFADYAAPREVAR